MHKHKGKAWERTHSMTSMEVSARRRGAVAALAAICATLTMLAVGVSSAFGAFGIAAFDGAVSDPVGGAFTQAGGHPDSAFTTFEVNTTTDSFGHPIPDGGQIRDLSVDLPPGFIGNPNAVPKCPDIKTLLQDGSDDGCPVETQVGYAVVQASIGFPFTFPLTFPIYNMEPPPGQAAAFSFDAVRYPVTLTGRVRSDGDYGISIDSQKIPQSIAVLRTTVTFWGVPADSSHDADRGEQIQGGFVTVCANNPDLSCTNSSTAPSVPLLSNPTRCTPQGVGLETGLHASSWALGDATADAVLISHEPPGYPLPSDQWGDSVGLTGCGDVPFDPVVALQATTDLADTPSGVDFELQIPEDGLSNPTGIAQAQVKKAEVTLPKGVTLNPSAAEGLGVCTPADFANEKLDSMPGSGCPNASKIGSVDIKSPVLNNPATGSLFLAQQDDPATSAPKAENPFDSLLALYVVARIPERGIIVKLAGKVEPDPRTGQIVTTFDDLPQLPFSKFHLHFREGGRAPLVSPPTCGTYTTEADFVPWSAADPNNPTSYEVTHTTSKFQIDRGVGGGPCPSGGAPPFKPDFSAGSINNNAGSYTPFTMRLIRADGEQDITRFSSILPPGVLGKLAGVSKCSDQAIAAAKAKTGREEIANPSCPANSQIGRILVGAGVGSVLIYVPGEVYLGGPVGDDPLSVVVITPAVAGPFDVGTVVTREALTLNPDTAEVEVDGKASDPIPHILEGIPLKLRDLRVYVDRDNFILNPTSCDPSSVKATLFGSYLDVFNPSDDVPVDLASRFQAANCSSLGFKPKLSINLKGGIRRGGHPALKAVLRARPGDANIGKATVTLPRSAFLDQGHIRTICTRVQFAAKACPSGAIYGYARAFTPLLDEPVEGPVYLRSSNHKLPDLVAALHGLVDVNIVGRIDSFKGGIRSSFESVPDAPVSKFVLSMQGGKKGLVVNSRNLCAGTNKADARFVGQNGKPYDFKPVVRASCGKGRRGKR